MDGLIFDTERLTYKIMRELANQHGFHFQLDHYKQIIGISEETSNNQLIDIYGSRIQSVFKEFPEVYNKSLNKENLHIKPGVMELLDTIEKKGIKKCIASSSSREVIEHYLKMKDLFNRFDFYVSGTEVVNGKPNPDVFIEACHRGNVELGEALVLEDSYNGFKAAVRAGIKCIIVPDLIEPNGEMRELAYRVCKDLGEVVELV